MAWLGIIVVLTIGVPSLDQVEKEHSVSLNPPDAQSFRAAARINEDFKQSDSGGSVAMIVLEGQQPLGDDAHRYYDRLIRQLKDDPKHVKHIQDFWGDELTRGAAQSTDGKAAYVQLTLPGNSGQTLGNESIEAVQHIVDRTPAPPGVKAYVTGPAAIAADMSHSGDRTVITITAVSVAVIFITLLLVYRSLITVVLLLLMVGIELRATQGIVAFLGHYEIIGLTTFVVNLLVSLVIATGTDYGIFFIGRYHEARQAGESREAAYYTTYRGVAKVVLASGLTIAGALFCLSFTRLPYFQVLGVPSAVGVLVAVAVALTLGPAVLTVGSRFGLFEPKRKIKARGWRRVGTTIVRWPAPVLIATLAVALVGLVTLPGYNPATTNSSTYPKTFLPVWGLRPQRDIFPNRR